MREKRKDNTKHRKQTKQNETQKNNNRETETREILKPKDK